MAQLILDRGLHAHWFKGTTLDYLVTAVDICYPRLIPSSAAYRSRRLHPTRLAALRKIEATGNVPRSKASLFADYKLAGIPGLALNALATYESGKTATADGHAVLPAGAGNWTLAFDIHADMEWTWNCFVDKMLNRAEKRIKKKELFWTLTKYIS